MSDYGDDYSDYGDDWFYVEDEYMAADDLAEHAVASPPPTTYGDDDMLPDWDRFDYFNDLEYASDGYDDATFQPHDAKDAKIGQKRKRVAQSSRNNKKRRRVDGEQGPANSSVVAHSPIVWRSQKEQKPKQRLLSDNAPSYALLKNWREDLADIPSWARGSPPAKSSGAQSGAAQEPSTAGPPAEAPPSEDEDLGEELEEGADMGITQEALMAALQRQLAAAGGPLSGMDPQQLLQFAMRMATDKDGGDDIAGEMADAMLGGDDDDDADAEENILSWVAQQRKPNNDASSADADSPDAARDSKRPPTPPLSNTNHRAKATINNAKTSEVTTETDSATDARATSSLKRKGGEETESVAKATKKRATRSFDAPTAASQARTASTVTTRTTRAKR